MIVRSNQFGVRRLENRTGGPSLPAGRQVRPYACHGHETRTRLRAETHSGVQAWSRYFVNTKGFTLTEIIILIVMAGILLPTIIVPFVAGVKASGKPEMATTAVYFAHYKMEEFMKYRYLNSALDPTAITSYADISGFPGYQWQWEIYYVDDNFNVAGDGIQATNHRGYKRIFVRVKDPMNDTYEIYSVVTFFH